MIDLSTPSTSDWLNDYLAAIIKRSDVVGLKKGKLSGDKGREVNGGKK